MEKIPALSKKLHENKDYITGRTLLKGFQLHHLCLDENNYEDLTNDEYYLPLNIMTHKSLHWCYNYYKNDKNFLQRLEEVLNKMIEINENENRRFRN